MQFAAKVDARAAKLARDAEEASRLQIGASRAGPMPRARLWASGCRHARVDPAGRLRVSTPADAGRRDDAPNPCAEDCVDPETGRKRRRHAPHLAEVEVELI